MAEEKPKPTATIYDHHDKRLKVSIWRLEGDDGFVMYKAEPSLRYTDANGEWKDGRSYNYVEMLRMAELMREATQRIRAYMRIEEDLKAAEEAKKGRLAGG